jgi:hypothetical protein
MTYEGQRKKDLRPIRRLGKLAAVVANRADHRDQVGDGSQGRAALGGNDVPRLRRLSIRHVGRGTLSAGLVLICPVVRPPG